MSRECQDTRDTQDSQDSRDKLDSQDTNSKLNLEYRITNHLKGNLKRSRWCKYSKQTVYALLPDQGSNGGRIISQFETKSGVKVTK